MYARVPPVSDVPPAVIGTRPHGFRTRPTTRQPEPAPRGPPSTTTS